MKNLKVLFLTILATTFIMSCDIDQTQKAQLPDVDVDVDAGQMPKFDVDWADVNVGTRTEMVSVPKIRVVMEEEEIQVPYIDVDMPNAGEKEELTLIAEAEVGGQSHKIDIIEVIATGRRLNVISQLEATGEDLGNEKMRVSDRLILNAPDLDVKHYIIGNRPAGSYNQQYTYVNSKNDAMKRIKNGKSIYSKK